MSRVIDTIIIGAGVAGLMAAFQLIRAGQRVVVVEARGRIGGRILTHHAGVPLELGAEFVHGLPEVTCSLLREARLASVELMGRPYGYRQSTVQATGEEPAVAFATLKAMRGWLALQPPGTDVSFNRYLDIAGISGPEAQHASRYVEGFNAADQNRISVAALAKQQVAEEAIQAERMFHLPGGYDALPRFLADTFVAAGGELRLSHPVVEIEWRRDAATVRGADATAPLASRRVIVTLPLGVLKAQSVRFAPDVPHLRERLQGLEMGQVIRLALLFRRPFWDALAPGMLFLFAPDESVPTWWTAHPGNSPQITGWIGGTTAIARLNGMQGRVLIENGLEQLAAMFRQPLKLLRGELVAAVAHDWMTDPWARGAYSYAAVGGIHASGELAQPVDATLFFAGEHTDDQGHWGTVHAALASGLRAARDVLNSA